MTTRNLNIVGCGKLGQTIARVFLASGVIESLSVCNRSLASALVAVSSIGTGTAVSSISELPGSSLWLIASSDEAITPICEEISSNGQLRAGDVVFHCSGAVSSDALRSARPPGASVASVHPIRSFAEPELASKLFSGTFCALEGDQSARLVLEKIFREVGAVVFEIPTASKMVCHAGHVFASNYLVTILAIAQKLYSASGIPEELSRSFMEPLVRGSVDNFFNLGGTRALTGPIARGDSRLVKEQNERLSEKNPVLGELYANLGMEALQLAIAQGLSRADAETVASALRRDLEANASWVTALRLT